jgi:cell division septum initiation protein DivIVA
MTDFSNLGDAGGNQHGPAASADVQQVNSELLTIASTIEDLQSRLQQANERLASASNNEASEYELGKLFVEAQRFSEASLAALETRISEILSEAETKAAQILAEATQEAQEIRRQAQEAAIASTASVHELRSAIAGFTVVNSELLKELGTLNSALTPAGEPAREGTLTERGQSAPTVALTREGENGNGTFGTGPGVAQ